jgi:hypothetical protein
MTGSDHSQLLCPWWRRPEWRAVAAGFDPFVGLFGQAPMRLRLEGEIDLATPRLDMTLAQAIRAHRCGGRGQSRPSWPSMPSWSLLPHRSTSLPSAKRLICMPRQLTFLPVAGWPMRSPRWVPLMV